MIQIRTLPQAKALHSLKEDERFQILQAWLEQERSRLASDLTRTQDLDLLRQQQGACQTLDALIDQIAESRDIAQRLMKKQ